MQSADFTGLCSPLCFPLTASIYWEIWALRFPVLLFRAVTGGYGMILGLIPGSLDIASLRFRVCACVNGYVHSAFGNGAWE